jgi:hypothetical protein
MLMPTRIDFEVIASGLKIESEFVVKGLCDLHVGHYQMEAV